MFHKMLTYLEQGVVEWPIFAYGSPTDSPATSKTMLLCRNRRESAFTLSGARSGSGEMEEGALSSEDFRPRYEQLNAQIHSTRNNGSKGRLLLVV